MESASHSLVYRSQGTQRYYQAGFVGKGKVAIELQDFGLTTLAEVDYAWVTGKNYSCEVAVKGSKIVFSINGEKLIELEDETWLHGMVGFALDEAGKSEIGALEVR